MVLLRTVRSTSTPSAAGCDGLDSPGVYCSFFFIGRNRIISCILFAVFPAGAEGNRHTDSQQQTEKPLHPAPPPLAWPRTEQIKNARISAATMVEPTGVPAKMEIKMPSAVQFTDSTAEQTVTDQKF